MPKSFFSICCVVFMKRSTNQKTRCLHCTCLLISSEPILICPLLLLAILFSIKELATSAWQRSLAFDNSHLSGWLLFDLNYNFFAIFLELFMGQIKSSLTCLKCYNVSASFETFWSLSLPLPLRAPV